ncbi:hypothetical protein I9T54_01165 [Campylobacter peloridis]|uniref:Periplasmic protein n=1 Tax=Campylobacter peloridis TaxID=488546 RepID=A0A5C7DSD2_9BACT|nr:hypothetical protein [Campylobacter peloridis]MBX2078150.1 hypothetical protein [Campylobacter peloridis]TXE83461.1 hypothetical protein FPD46_02150 [Campylobacter peloridis]
MKKSFIMFYTIFFILFISFLCFFIIKLSSYPPRIIKDFAFYTQAKILLHNSKELSKYFLYQAYNEKKECIETIYFQYANSKIRLDFVYPLGECKNAKFKANYDNAMSIVAVNASVLINDNKGVNEEIFLQRSFFIYPKFD